MARIRTIKPSFFKNEDLAELPMSARVLFIGLWCLCDKEGRMEDRPKRIKVELFPYDSIDVDQSLSRLQSAGFVTRYEVGELKVIQVINFSKHQRITGTEAETQSEFPAPDNMEGNTLETTRKHFGNTLDDREGNGKEGNKERKGDSAHDDFFLKNYDQKKINSPPPKICMPFSESEFGYMWDQWKLYKSKEFKFSYKSAQSEQAALDEIVKLSEGKEDRAIGIIKQSMAKGWKGFFELKNNLNGTAKGKWNGNEVSTPSAFSKIDSMPD